ncbi:MAG: hypothetical protein CMN28_08660 [Salinisphaeraceae bacterium]|nr:hypothetical protein [Salinisphaeraceae bacterium]
MSTPPPGQHYLERFPRFGLGRFANYGPAAPGSLHLSLKGDVSHPVELTKEDLASLESISLKADFHCVTTWSYSGLLWGGYRFVDFYRTIVQPRCRPEPAARLVVFRAADGYACSLPLGDLLAEDVMLADRLNGESLGFDHGAPLRLVAPAHYGYKNVKHLVAIEFWRDARHYRFPRPYPRFMDHPRARVAREERARWVPAWLIRPFYARLVQPTIARFERRRDGR